MGGNLDGKGDKTNFHILPLYLKRSPTNKSIFIDTKCTNGYDLWSWLRRCVHALWAMAVAHDLLAWNDNLDGWLWWASWTTVMKFIMVHGCYLIEYRIIRAIKTNLYRCIHIHIYIDWFLLCLRLGKTSLGSVGMFNYICIGWVSYICLPFNISKHSCWIPWLTWEYYILQVCSTQLLLDWGYLCKSTKWASSNL